MDLGVCHAYVLTPEDVLLSKLRWIALARRHKDIGDFMQVLVSRFSSLDWPYLRRWSRELGAEAELDRLLAQKDDYAG